MNEKEVVVLAFADLPVRITWIDRAGAVLGEEIFRHFAARTGKWSIEEIRIAIEKSGHDPDYGDGFWEVNGAEIAKALLVVIDEPGRITKG